MFNIFTAKQQQYCMYMYTYAILIHKRLVHVSCKKNVVEHESRPAVMHKIHVDAYKSMYM